MRIVALMNQKGGVGKTTTTANLGAALAEMGKRVLLIDVDPQAHLTINYGIEPTGDFVSLYHVLTEEKSLLEAMQKIDDRMAIVPSGIDLAAAEIELVSVIGREMLLKKRLESGEDALDFDYVLLDCPPSLGILTINALSAAHEVIIPMLPHFLALQGMAKLLETVQLVNKRMNPRLKIGGVVLTMFDSQTKLSGEVVSELENFIVEARGRNLPWSNAIIFETKIRRNIKLAECPSFGQTIMKYGPASAGALDYRALAQEVIRMHEPVQAAAPVVAQIAPPAPKPVIVAAPKPAPIPPVMPATPKASTATLSTPKAARTAPPNPPKSVAPAKPVAAPVPPKVEVAINPDLNIDKVPVPAPKGEVAA